MVKTIQMMLLNQTIYNKYSSFEYCKFLEQLKGKTKKSYRIPLNLLHVRRVAPKPYREVMLVAYRPNDNSIFPVRQNHHNF